MSRGLGDVYKRQEHDPKARIIVVDYEPVTGSHVGPGALAMFYVAKEPWSSAIC